MTTFEIFLVEFDEWPLSAIWRVALGFIFPEFMVLAGNPDSVWSCVGLFLLLLIGLRVGPALLRFALPFSKDVKEMWRKRRFISKEYDSFQWQKLFWIGLGMVPHAVAGAGLGLGGWVLAAFCLVGGGAGLAFWINAQRTMQEMASSVARPNRSEAPDAARAVPVPPAFAVSSPGASERDKG